MATNYTKMKFNKPEEVQITYNDEVITIKTYLPVQLQAEMIATILNTSFNDSEMYYNPIQIEVSTMIEILTHCTDIKFTKKQLEKPTLIYDDFILSDLYNQIIEQIKNYDKFLDNINSVIESVYKYMNSANGILRGLVEDYSNLELDTEKLKNQIADLGNTGILKEVLTKLPQSGQ